MNGLIAKLLTFPGVAVFIFEYRRTGNTTALLAGCDFVMEEEAYYPTDYTVLAVALKSAILGV